MNLAFLIFQSETIATFDNDSIEEFIQDDYNQTHNYNAE